MGLSPLPSVLPLPLSPSPLLSSVFTTFGITEGEEGS